MRGARRTLRRSPQEVTATRAASGSECGLDGWPTRAATRAATSAARPVAAAGCVLDPVLGGKSQRSARVEGWVQAVVLVLLFGFFVLGLLAYRTYQAKPPIAERVVDPSGRLIYTERDVERGRKSSSTTASWSTARCHGAYLGPTTPPTTCAGPRTSFNVATAARAPIARLDARSRTSAPTATTSGHRGERDDLDALADLEAARRGVGDHPGDQRGQRPRAEQPEQRSRRPYLARKAGRHAPAFARVRAP